MVYLRHFILLDGLQEHDIVCYEERRQIFNNCYPLHLFSTKEFKNIDFGCTSSDRFTGIVAKDFNSKELFLYEPYWYKNLCKKCKEAPDKLHILFLEELTNAKSDIQKLLLKLL